MLLPSFPGTEPPDWALRLLAEGLGGITYFAYNVAGSEDGGDEQLAALSARLRAERPGAVLAIDEEAGDVSRLDAERGGSWPGALALGAVDDVHATRAVAGAIGARLAAAGVTLDFAPVADVNSDPRNPVIGVRSFGDDPALVGRHVAAFVEGLQAAGVAACAKHFPGHGDTTVDSHHALPRVDVGLETLRARELRPFRDAVAAGVRAVMTAHLVVAALDERPATVSPRALALLRDELDSTERSSRTRSRCAASQPPWAWSRAPSRRSPPASTRSAWATTCTRRRSRRSPTGSSTRWRPDGCRRSGSPRQPPERRRWEPNPACAQ